MKCFRGTANHRQTRHRDLYNLQPTNTFGWQLLHNIKRVKSGPSGRHITAAKHSGVKLSVRGGQRAQLLSHITVVSEKFQLPRWDMVFLVSDQGFFFFYGLYKELVTVTSVMMMSNTKTHNFFEKKYCGNQKVYFCSRCSLSSSSNNDIFCKQPVFVFKNNW